MNTILRIFSLTIFAICSTLPVQAMQRGIQEKNITEVINHHGMLHLYDQVVLITYPNPMGMGHMTGAVLGQEVEAKAFPLTVFDLWPEKAPISGFQVNPKHILLVVVGKYAHTFTPGDLPGNNNRLVIEKDDTVRFEKIEE